MFMKSRLIPGGRAVFARSSTLHADPSKIEAGTAYVQDALIPAMARIDGFVGLSMMVDRATPGRCIVTSAWRTEAAMDAGAEHVKPIRDAAAERFGARTVETWAWEVAVMHRAHHARRGTCLRAIWTRTPPTRMAEAVELFKSDTLARIEELPGFCSASLLVSRKYSLAVATVGYDDETALELSRDAGAALRNEATQQTASDIIDVSEFDLSIAHLHVPETD
jgi:heme-degrading monooxygenase HmoA